MLYFKYFKFCNFILLINYSSNAGYLIFFAKTIAIIVFIFTLTEHRTTFNDLRLLTTCRSKQSSTNVDESKNNGNQRR